MIDLAKLLEGTRDALNMCVNTKLRGSHGFKDSYAVAAAWDKARPDVIRLLDPGALPFESKVALAREINAILCEMHDAGISESRKIASCIASDQRIAAFMHGAPASALSLFYVRSDMSICDGQEQQHHLVWAESPLQAVLLTHEYYEKDETAPDEYEAPALQKVGRPHTDDLGDVWTVWTIPAGKPTRPTALAWDDEVPAEFFRSA